MPAFPDPPSVPGNAPVRLRLAAERDIPEVLIAHQDDPALAGRLGLARSPSGAELGRRAEAAATEQTLGTRLWLTVLPSAAAPLPDECRGQIDIDDVDWHHRRATLRIWIAPRDRGRGLASAALGLAAGWLLDDCGLTRVGLLVDPANQAMRRAAAAAGFQSEGVLRGRRLGADGRRADEEVFSRISPDRLRPAPTA